jgi:hypothetical protein
MRMHRNRAYELAGYAGGATLMLRPACILVSGRPSMAEIWVVHRAGEVLCFATDWAMWRLLDESATVPAEGSSE